MSVDNLHVTCDQLNGLNFPNLEVDPMDAGHVIAALTRQLTRVTSDAALLLKWCQITVAIMRKHETYFETTDLALVIDMHVTHLRAALVENHVLVPALLRALSFVLHENSPRYLTKIPELLALLVPLVDFEKHVTDREVPRLAASCLGSIATKSGPKSGDIQREIINTLLRALNVTRNILSRDASMARSVAAVLHALALAVNECRVPNFNPAVPPPPSLFGTLARLTALGTVDKPDLPAHLATLPSTTSDSELSDSDAGDRFQFWKVRLHALNVLQALVRTGGVAHFVQFWPQLLPASVTSPPPHLCAIISTDPVHKVRGAALQLLQVMVDGSSKYLVLVDDTQSTVAKSFTPLSRTLGAVVRTLHHVLLQVLATELRANTLLQLLKCLSVVIDNMPYDRLSTNVIAQLVLALEHVIFKSHEDVAIRASAVTCFTHVLNTKTPLNEVQRVLTASDSTAQLAARLCALLGSDTLPPHLTAELFRAFAAMCGHYYSAVKLVWPDLLLHTLTATKSKEISVRIAAVTLLDGVAKSVAKSVDAHEFWTAMMTSAVTDLFHDEINAVRATVCNCFSQVPARVFDALARDQRIMMQTVMLGLARDEAPLVRATASRTLGVYITFKSLSSDALFVADVALALTDGLNDKNLNVRNRASWGLGNLCDALIGVSEDSAEVAALEDIPKDILVNVIKCAVRATRDNDKVRANAVRALGNFLRFAPLELLQEYNELASSVFETLMQHTTEGSVKVRWNACYALGNAFHNRAMHHVTLSLTSKHGIPFSERIAGSLAHVLCSATNFKVRINAASALAQLQSRDAYGRQLGAVWRAVVEATVTIDANQDPASYQYKNTLQDQLLATLQHVIAITIAEDVTALGDMFTERAAALFETLHFNYEISKHSPLKSELERAKAVQRSHEQLLTLLAPLHIEAIQDVKPLAPL
jgi:hypothetical protein